MNDDFRSTFLFARPSWYEGVARLLDFGNALTEYNRTSAAGDADVRATTQDWLVVGDRIREAMANFAANARA